MSIEALPLNLYKANTELQLRLTRLLQESGHRWLEATQQPSSENISETTAEIEGLLRSANWQSLTTLPAESFWRLFQSRITDTQTINQIAVKNQAAFTAGVQQALESWQKSVTEVVGATTSAQPFPDIFKQWGAIWQPAAENTKAKAEKAG